MSGSSNAKAPKHQTITLYQKPKSLVIGIDADERRSWPKLSNGSKMLRKSRRGSRLKASA
jgi:hypothetical protein